MQRHWAGAEPQLTSAPPSLYPDFIGPPHSPQPALKSNNCRVPFVFLLMRTISKVARVSCARSGPRQVWQCCSVKVLPPRLVTLCKKNLQTSANSQPKVKRKQKEKDNRRGPTTEATCASQGLCERGFRYSLCSLSPTLYFSKGWQSPGLAWV